MLYFMNIIIAPFINGMYSSGDVSVDLPYNLKAGVRVNGNIRGYKLERERPSGSINFRSNYRQDQSSLIDLTVQGRLTWGQSFLKIN